MTENSEIELISQADLDNLLRINEFIDEQDENSLVSELKEAILDSGKLELFQWESLRDHIREIEELIPHIDLIIKLKKA
jgi:hypothetical protein